MQTAPATLKHYDVVGLFALAGSVNLERYTKLAGKSNNRVGPELLGFSGSFAMAGSANDEISSRNFGPCRPI